MSECEICFSDDEVIDDLCRVCRDWEMYWFNLTPEQQKIELQRMARYTEEKAS